jgi:hypothetical protein
VRVATRRCWPAPWPARRESDARGEERTDHRSSSVARG